MHKNCVNSIGKRVDNFFMDFKNRLKGSITQTLLKALLEDAGYRIVPLDIEEVIREVKDLSASEYNALDLPPVLKKMPDFFVTDKNFEKTWLVEVKYRRRWNEATKTALRREIVEQVKSWQSVYLVVFLGEPARDADTPASSIGVLQLIHSERQLFCRRFKSKGFSTHEIEEYRTPWDEINWGHFDRFQDVFRDIGERWEESTLIKSLSLLESLRRLDLFE